MIEDLVIHIGNHKTASTSMQKCLHEKSYEMNKEFYYPESLGGMVPYNHNYYVRSLFTSRGKDIFPILIEKIKPHKNVVISSAAYSYFSALLLKKHIDEVYKPLAKNIRIIWYVRPQIDWLTAAYLERIRIGTFKGSIEEYLEILNLGWFRNGYHYKKAFGESIHFRVMVPEALVQEDPVSDLLHFIADGEDYRLLKKHRDNVMIPVQHLAIIKRYQETNYRGEEEGKADGYALTYLLRDRMPIENPIKYVMAKDLALELSEKYFEKDSERFDKVFMGSQPFLEKALRKSIDGCPDKAPSLEVYDQQKADEFFASLPANWQSVK